MSALFEAAYYLVCPMTVSSNRLLTLNCLAGYFCEILTSEIDGHCVGTWLTPGRHMRIPRSEVTIGSNVKWGPMSTIFSIER